MAVLLLASALAFGQNRTVTGVVRDSKGDPVPFATVAESGSGKAVKADDKGAYSITVGNNARLTFTATGFQSQTVSADAAGSITLATAEGQLAEVVVTTAQGIRREKRGLGYSAPVVRSEELTRGQSTSALNALQGKVSGVNITTTAGAPNSSSRIVIRGGSSIAGSNQALLVVDGIPIDNSSILGGSSLSSVDFGNRGNDINPDDIENITVLKGPGATALYGSRASNGALIITTKSGRGAANRKTNVTFSTGITLSSILKLPDFQNEYGEGYDNATNDPKENWSWGPRFDGAVRGWGQTINGVQQQRPYSAVKDNVRDFFETGTALNNSLSFTGGNAQSSYFLSLNSLNSDGIMPTDRDKYNRYSVRFNGSTQLANKISSSISVNYTRVNSNLVGGGQGGGSVYDNVLQTPRNIPLPDLKDLNNPYNSIGGFFDPRFNELYGYYGAYTINPYYVLKAYNNRNNVDRVIGNFTVTYKPLDWLSITNRLGGDVYADRRVETDPKYNLVPFDSTTGQYSAVANVRSAPGRYYEANYNVSDITNDLIVTATKKFGSDWNASLVLGHNVRVRTVNTLEAQTNAAGGLVIPGFYNLSNSNGPVVSNNNQTNRRLVGVYGDFNLGYKNFLFLDVTARNDWSSTLPKESNSFFYPSVSASFVFTELLKNTGVNNWLQYGKLRTSWAKVGNDADPNLLESYYNKTTINGGFGSTVFPFNNVPGYTVGNQLGNPVLRPENTTAYEVGAELNFLHNRLSLDASYYRNNSRDQILPVPIAASTGFTARVINAGLVKNRGVEIALRGTPVKTNDFSWELYGTYTRNRNEVSGLDVDQIVLGGFSGMSITAANGKPYGNFYSRDLLRDDQGHVIVDASSGLPLLTPTAVYLGTYNPDYQASLGTNINFKGFSLGLLFDTKQGGKFYSRTKDILDFVGTAAETAEGDRDGYVFPNSVYQDASGKYVPNTSVKFLPQDYYPSIVDGQNVIDASYIKLREANLTYTFPKTWLNGSPFGTASLSLFGNNLWIKTAKENRYVDPEVNSAGSGNTQGFDFTAQPSVRNYGVNLKVTF